MTLDEFKSLMKEYDEDFEDILGIEVVEEGAWEQDLKYQCRESIVKDTEGNYFLILMSRSGSYHTDWYYNETEIYQVIPIETVVTTVEWKRV